MWKGEQKGSISTRRAWLYQDLRADLYTGIEGKAYGSAMQ